MELHRLKTMSESYDQVLFNRLYNETKGLRKSLVFQIDARRFNVTQDIIESWFDDKFIFVFNKYYSKVSNEVLKGYIINSLKTFKFRILRKAYSGYTMISIDDTQRLVNIIPDKQEEDNYGEFLELALSFLKTKLSDNAMLVLETEINPPEYILDKVSPTKTKIPAKMLCEYLGLEANNNAITLINSLRKEIKSSVEEARKFFNGKLLQV